MSIENEETWNERVRATLRRYSEGMLRQVAQNLLKPRNLWPVDELIERSVTALGNAALTDRRIKDLPESSRRLLAAVGLSRQPIWRVGELLGLLAVLNHAEGMTPILALLDAGLAHPVIGDVAPKLKQFEDWLGASGMTTARVMIHPAVSERLLGDDLGLPALPSRKLDSSSSLIADGFEWPIRLAVAWQMVMSGSVRLTQQGTLFKRDMLRFQNDPRLSSPIASQAVDLPDPGLLAWEWAEAVGLLENESGELRGVANPALWNLPLAECLKSLWRQLFAVERWCPRRGHCPPETSNAFPSTALASFLLLRAAAIGDWVSADTVAAFLRDRHPSWSAGLGHDPDSERVWLETLWLGVGASLRLVDAARIDDVWWFRLGDLGRHLLQRTPLPALEHEYRQTLVIQPNGEMIVFRQGLTPALIGALSRFADWKMIGSACTMELTAESVYRGLETGLAPAEVQRLLEQHGTRTIPGNVLDALQRWSSKRERISVHASATLLEFITPEDLEAAFTRGLVTTKLTDRIGIAAGGDEIDYRHFRLLGNRDYEAKPQKCITFEADGVTFTVDAAQSDLLLEAELGRLAERLPDTIPGQRRYALTPTSLSRLRDQGWSISELEQWALNRSEAPLSSSARLLFGGSGDAGTYRKRLVVSLPNQIIADGIVQWPPTGSLIEERIGPESLAVSEGNLPLLLERLKSVGVTLDPSKPESP